MKTSEQIDKISEALAAAHCDFKSIEKNKTLKTAQYTFHYADLSAIIDSTRDALSKNGLCITQCPDFTNNRIVVTTRLIHKSGQWIETMVSLKPGQDTPQALGAAITYGRRYGRAAILDICAEDDDDAQSAQPEKQKQQQKQQPKKEDQKPPPPIVVPIVERIRKMITMFATLEINGANLAITPENLSEFLQKPLFECTEQDLGSLGTLYKELRDGKKFKEDFLEHLRLKKEIS